MFISDLPWATSHLREFKGVPSTTDFELLVFDVVHQ